MSTSGASRSVTDPSPKNFGIFLEQIYPILRTSFYPEEPTSAAVSPPEEHGAGIFPLVSIRLYEAVVCSHVYPCLGIYNDPCLSVSESPLIRGDIYIYITRPRTTILRSQDSCDEWWANIEPMGKHLNFIRGPYLLLFLSLLSLFPPFPHSFPSSSPLPKPIFQNETRAQPTPQRFLPVPVKGRLSCVGLI